MRGNNDLSALHGKWENWLEFETQNLAVYAGFILYLPENLCVAPKNSF